MNMTIAAYPIEKEPDEVDSTRAFVNMPVNARPLRVVRNQTGFAVLALVAAENSGVRVRHPLTIAPVNLPLHLLLGESLGDCIGEIPLGAAPALVLKRLPWPSSALEAAAVQGHG